jgi:hypothetical protein
LQYVTLADAYEEIEATTKRQEMTDLLVDLLKKTLKEVIAKVAYLTQGRIYPDFVGIEIGIAKKLAVKALAGARTRWIDAFGGEVARRVLKTPQGIMPRAIVQFEYPAKTREPTSGRPLDLIVRYETFQCV